MARPGVSVSDATDDYDVIGSEPDDGHGWDQNEMMRAQGDDESEPLDDEDEVGDDLEDAIDAESEDDEETLEADADEDGPDDDEDADEDGDDEADDEHPPIDPPANWPEAVRENFSAMPPALQHWLLGQSRHMTADYTRKTQELANVRRAYAEFDRVLTPYTRQWAIDGMNPAQAVHQVLALSDMAREDPVGFIKYLANYRGIDLKTLAQPAEEEYIDPQVRELRRQHAEVQARLNQFEQMTQHQQQQTQVQNYQRAFHTTNAAIDNFASQTGPDGKPLYPDFDKLEEDMAALIETGRAKTVHEAYETAKWANPFTRAKLLARSRTADNARARQQAREARRAASSVSGASSGYGNAPDTEGMSIRDLLHAGMEGAL